MMFQLVNSSLNAPLYSFPIGLTFDEGFLMDKKNERTLILLSCSREKNSGGSPYPPNGRQIFQYIGAQKGEHIHKRYQMYSYLHAQGGRILSEDSRDGYLDERGKNPELIEGPDFGCETVPLRNKYLFAFERYQGRFANGLLRTNPDFWNNLPSYPVEIFFVSALYGILLWNEPIQDYDCNLSDFLQFKIPKNKKNDEKTLQEFWRNHLTKVICEFLSEAKKDNPVKIIYDLLSEETYQKAIRWKDVLKTHEDVEIRHRVFQEDNNESGHLLNLGSILGSDLDRFLPDSSNPFKVNEWNNTNSNGKIMFVDSYEEGFDQFSEFLTEVERDDLSKADNHFDSNKNESNAKDIIMRYSRFLEGVLRRVFKNDSLKMGSVGNAIKTDLDQNDLFKNLVSINKLRNISAHKDRWQNPTLADAQKVKDETFIVLKKLRDRDHKNNKHPYE